VDIQKHRFANIDTATVVSFASTMPCSFRRQLNASKHLKASQCPSLHEAGDWNKGLPTSAEFIPAYNGDGGPFGP
jgi:hypothetical protein